MDWPNYYHNLAIAVALNSKCHSRQIGAVLVQDNVVISTGYNGPPHKYSHCQNQCPRRAAGFPSGEGLHLCPAAHAEQNCIANAARAGVRILGATMYLTCEHPCKVCTALIVNSGIKEIWVVSDNSYDKLGPKMSKAAGLLVKLYHETLR